MSEFKNLRKKFTIGTASILMVAPLVLSSVAPAANAKRVHHYHSHVSRYMHRRTSAAARRARRYARNRRAYARKRRAYMRKERARLKKSGRQLKRHRKQLKHAYVAAYPQTHAQAKPQAAVQHQADHLTDNQLLDELVDQYLHTIHASGPLVAFFDSLVQNAEKPQGAQPIVMPNAQQNAVPSSSAGQPSSAASAEPSSAAPASASSATSSASSSAPSSASQSVQSASSSAASSSAAPAGNAEAADGTYAKGAQPVNPEVDMSRMHGQVEYRAVKQLEDSHPTAPALKDFGKFINQRIAYFYPGIAVNFRDLGGYKTADGRYVKTGRIFRSNYLIKNTAAAKKDFEGLHINHSIDLRTTYQIKKHPDAPYAHSKVDQVFTGSDITKVNKYIKAHGLKGMKDQQYRYKALMIESPRAEKAYHYVFNQLLNNKQGAVVYHCIDGRDRTGITSILILNALGVPKKTAIQDYLLSPAVEHNMPIAKQYQLIQGFFSAVDQKYGSVHNYLTNGVGVTNAQIQQLQQMYLTK